MPAAEIARNGRREPPIGIDLGTTYSLVACLDATGRPLSLLNALGDVLTPSAILVDEDRVVVGKEAIRAGACAPASYADCFKRDMGRPKFRRPVHGHTVPPEVLSAVILDQLRHDAQRQLGPLSKAVITVPAYFDELRRNVTQDAGRLAGWDVLDIINEPIAAALAYGLERKCFGIEQTENDVHERIVVYDLGGGTFDATLLEIEGSIFRTLATDGDVQLGGRDFDDRLVNYLAEQFFAAHGLDPRMDPRDGFQLREDAEDAKRALSQQPSVSIVCLHAGIRMQVEVSCATFEELCRDLLERTRETTDALVRQAGFTWRQIDRVLLSGGAVRMPMVGRMLRDLTGKEPDRTLSPDQAVAHGAAIYAGMLLEHPALSGRRRCELINVNSHSLGVIGVNERVGQHVNAVLIPRNTPIPSQAIKTFKTLEAGQRNVAVPVIEGESESPEFCQRLGKCVVRDLPPGLPKGTPVEVNYRYLSNGRLAVSAFVPSTGHSAGVEIEREHPAVAGTVADWKEHLVGRPIVQEPDEPTRLPERLPLGRQPEA